MTTPTADPAADPGAADQARAEAIRALTAAASQRATAQHAERLATDQVRRAVLAAREAGVPVRRIAMVGGVSIDTIDRWWKHRWFWDARIVVTATTSRGRPTWGGLVSRITTYSAVGRRADGTPLSAADARAPLDQPRDDDDVLRILGDAFPGADIDLVYDIYDTCDAYDDEDEDCHGEDQADDGPDPIVQWEISVTVREVED